MATKRQGANVLAMPDAGGDTGRAALAANAYMGLWEQRQGLANQQLMNEDDDDAPMVVQPSPAAPDGLLRDADGSVMTYKTRKAKLDRAMGHLVKSVEDIRELFDAALERERSQRFG
jgi:hypothetical protein